MIATATMFQWQKNLSRGQIVGLLVLCGVLMGVSNKLDDMIDEKRKASASTTKDGWRLDDD